MAQKPQKLEYMGVELHFDETRYNRSRKEYQTYCTLVEPIAADLQRMGLKPLTGEAVARIEQGRFDSFLDEYKQLAEAQEVGFIFKPIKSDAIEKGANQLEAYLRGHSMKLSQVRIYIASPHDCPFIDGVPVITPEFEVEIRERFTNRINTEKGALFYQKFIQANALIREMKELGFEPHSSYGLDAGGLQLHQIAL